MLEFNTVFLLQMTSVNSHHTPSNSKGYFVAKKNSFSHQRLKRFAYRVKLSDSIFFLLGLSSIVK